MTEEKPWVSWCSKSVEISQRVNAMKGERKWTNTIFMTHRQAKKLIQELEDALRKDYKERG